VHGDRGLPRHTWTVRQRSFRAGASLPVGCSNLGSMSTRPVIGPRSLVRIVRRSPRRARLPLQARGTRTPAQRRRIVRSVQAAFRGGVAAP